MINLHKQFLSFYEKHNCLHGVHHDGKGIDATVPSELGTTPVTIRYCKNKSVVSRVFIPTRIPENKKVSVNELITRFNNTQIRPQLVLDYERRLVYSSRNVSIEQLEAESDWVDLLLDSNFKQLFAVHDALIAVLYNNALPEAVIDEFTQRNSTKVSKQGANLSLHDRLSGLFGGDPRLN